jgi:hypothetical protein
MDPTEGYSRCGNGVGSTNNIENMSHSEPKTEACNQDAQSEDLNYAMEEGRSNDAHEYSSDREEKEYRRPH